MYSLINHFKNTFLAQRFFVTLFLILLFYVVGNFIPLIFILSQAITVIFGCVVLFDFYLLITNRSKIKIVRRLPKTLYLNHEFEVITSVENNATLNLKVELIEEIPDQFQWRDNVFNLLEIKKGDLGSVTYSLIPSSRGRYIFKNSNVFIKTSLSFLKIRIVQPFDVTLECLPSVPEMILLEKQFFNKYQNIEGVKKTRKVGHSYEFDQIKQYTIGDDIRTINWKATGRKSSLMVNQYEDQKAQQIYSIIDKGRAMSPSFNNLSLLDYAINSSLSISNIALKKDDKAGLITFSDKIGTTIKASREKNQLHKILRALYNEEERVNVDGDFDLLYRGVKNIIRGRSLLFLYTNFENEDTLKKSINILKKIGKYHLLVVVLFENKILENFVNIPAKNVKDVFEKTAAKYTLDKKQTLTSLLNLYGIETILTSPENLSINIVNKYNELKSKGLI